MDNNTMYILGAGASIGADRYPKNRWFNDKRMPSGKNFFKDLFEKEKVPKSGLDFTNLLALTYEGTNQIIIQAWRINNETHFFDKNEWQGVNIEDVFTFFDIGTNMYDKKSNYYKAFRHGRESLVDFIFIMILMRTINQRCLHLEKLFKNIKPDDVIISFNWDLIADSTLDYLKLPHLYAYTKLFESETVTDNSNDSGMFLKLHGSVNWMICRNRKCEKYNKIQLIQANSENPILDLKLNDFNDCKFCGSRLHPYLVPPTSNKVDIHSKNILNRSWLICRDKLKDCDKLVFIGYSFPPTDFYSEWLFRQINFLVDKNDIFQTMDIIVVNPEMQDKNSMTYQRYNSIFNGHNIKIYNTLYEFVKNPPLKTSHNSS